MNKLNLATDLGIVYRDIMAIEVDMTDSFNNLMTKFYKIMRKHGICQGTWSDGGGRTLANPEWCLCYNTFEKHVTSRWNWAILLSEPPKDLLAYGKKPKLKRVSSK